MNTIKSEEIVKKERMNQKLIIGKIFVKVMLITIIFNGCLAQEAKMNTTKSEKIVQIYRQNKTKYKRKVQILSGTWETTPEKLFPLFCPAREADWIPGWDCQLIYTESGYAEDRLFSKRKNQISRGKDCGLLPDSS